MQVSLFRNPLTGIVDLDGHDFVVDPDVFFNLGVLQGLDNVLDPAIHEYLGCPENVDLSPISSAGSFSTLVEAIIATNNDFTITVNGPNTSKISGYLIAFCTFLYYDILTTRI